MTLAETQALFHAALAGAPEATPERIAACFTGTPELPAGERVGIYADMVLWRQVNALREDFPKLVALLGDGPFFSLARAYVLEVPSRHHDLGRRGERLAAWLRSRTDLPRPDLADLAELEWARDDVFFEAPERPATPEAMARLSPESFAAARLRLVPALRLLDLGYDAPSLWRRLEDGKAPGEHLRRPTPVAVWRPEHQVFHAALPRPEAEALRRAAAGAPLSEVCAAFDGPGAAGEAFAAIGSWLAEGWVAEVVEEP